MNNLAIQNSTVMTLNNLSKPRRSVLMYSICAIATLCLCGCSEILDRVLERESDRRAERQYIRSGDTPKEAQRKVYEDNFFRNVGGRP